MNRNRKYRKRNALLVLLLLTVVLGAPVAVGTYLLNAASAPSPIRYSDTESELDRVAGRPLDSGVASGRGTSPLVSGVLYTSGSVKVNWSGIQMPVENTTYAYLGGEIISTAPNAMGILKLDSGSVVFVCPNSRVRVSRDSSGEMVVDVLTGSGRFMIEEDDPFRVQVNNAVLSAAADASSEALTRHAYTGEGVATEDGGCVLCNLSKNLAVGVDDGGRRRTATASGGEIVTVKGAGGAPGSNPISSLKLPGNVFASMRAAMASNGVTGLGYLCKCRELRDYAERAGDRFAVQPQLALTTVVGEPLSDATPDLPQLPNSQPAVAPPPVPDVTVAEGGEPNPFVPGLLPAAGEPQPQSESNIVIPPPLVPGSGSGGGGTVSSS